MGGRIAGHQTGSRHPHDFYPTHPDWTRALLAHVELTRDVWEPACGDGAMVRVLKEAGHEVRGTDIAHGHDFLESDLRAGSIVTNPPYRLLDEFVRQGLRQAEEYLCLLVGWHLLAGGSRRVKGLWRVCPPNLVVRPSGADARERFGQPVQPRVVRVGGGEPGGGARAEVAPGQGGSLMGATANVEGEFA